MKNNLQNSYFAVENNTVATAVSVALDKGAKFMRYNTLIKSHFLIRLILYRKENYMKYIFGKVSDLIVGMFTLLAMSPFLAIMILMCLVFYALATVMKWKGYL